MVIADLTKKREFLKTKRKKSYFGDTSAQSLVKVQNKLRSNEAKISLFVQKQSGREVFFFVFPACFLLSILTFLRNRGILLIIYY